MIAESTMSKGLYPKAWHYLFETGTGTMYDWAHAQKMSPRVMSAISKFGGMGPFDLEYALTSGDGPPLSLRSGFQPGGRWIFSEYEIALAYRILKSYEMGILPEDEFRDLVIIPAIVAWNSISLLHIEQGQKAYEQATKFMNAAYGSGVIKHNHLAGKELEKVIPPDPSFGLVSQPKTPAAVTPKVGPLRRFFQHRKDVRAARAAT